MTELEQYRGIGRRIREILALKSPLVAVSLLSKPEDIPTGVEELDSPMFYCCMVKYAMAGNTFYATDKLHECKRGASALGLTEPPKEEITGEFYFNKASCSSRMAARRYFESAPCLRAGSVYATLLSPLETAPLKPDVVIAETIPRRALEVIQASIFERGGKVESWFSAPRQICSYSTVRPYLGSLNITFACEFSRNKAREMGLDYLDEGVIIGIPAELLPRIAENLPLIGYIKKRLGEAARHDLEV
ncbi:MAG: DUF169 domain-containing protein [Candidatus Hadarchaeum sp.]|uniref:DUF169 domain-containing protein n=1 Tax=Candidatus Hadarchaeum sp. TaxID=2883567 RepID=UPI003D139B83